MAFSTEFALLKARIESGYLSPILFLTRCKYSLSSEIHRWERAIALYVMVCFRNPRTVNKPSIQLMQENTKIVRRSG